MTELKIIGTVTIFTTFLRMRIHFVQFLLAPPPKRKRRSWLTIYLNPGCLYLQLQRKTTGIFYLVVSFDVWSHVR
jgi:hypothetical protein